MSSWVSYPKLHTILSLFSPYIAEIDSHKVENSVESTSKSILNIDSYMIYLATKHQNHLTQRLDREEMWYTPKLLKLPETREKLHHNKWLLTEVLSLKKSLSFLWQWSAYPIKF